MWGSGKRRGHGNYRVSNLGNYVDGAASSGDKGPLLKEQLQFCTFFIRGVWEHLESDTRK